MDRVAGDIAARTELSGPDYAVLSRLVLLGHGEFRQHDLADSMRWDKSRLSHHLTKMEKRGFIERRREKKIVSVFVTKAGREAFANARPVQAEAVREHFVSKVGKADMKVLLEICERIQAFPEEEW